MKLARCDNCQVDIPLGVPYLEVTHENEIMTVGYQGGDKQFCNALCVAVYHAHLAGKEVVDAHTGR